jgi:hypothetical protein
MAMSDASAAELNALTEVEGTGQRLYWDIREAYRDAEVSSAVWELTRRVSHTKHLLIFTEAPQMEFAEGLPWINVQCRVTIRLCAKRIGLPVERDTAPFFLGLGGIAEEQDPKYHSQEPPWSDIQHKRALERAKRSNPGRVKDP